MGYSIITESYGAIQHSKWEQRSPFDQWHEGYGLRKGRKSCLLGGSGLSSPTIVMDTSTSKRSLPLYHPIMMRWYKDYGLYKGRNYDLLGDLRFLKPNNYPEYIDVKSKTDVFPSPEIKKLRQTKKNCNSQEKIVRLWQIMMKSIVKLIDRWRMRLLAEGGDDEPFAACGGGDGRTPNWS